MRTRKADKHLFFSAIRAGLRTAINAFLEPPSTIGRQTPPPDSDLELNESISRESGDTAADRGYA